MSDLREALDGEFFSEALLGEFSEALLSDGLSKALLGELIILLIGWRIGLFPNYSSIWASSGVISSVKRSDFV